MQKKKQNLKMKSTDSPASIKNTARHTKMDCFKSRLPRGKAPGRPVFPTKQ